MSEHQSSHHIKYYGFENHFRFGLRENRNMFCDLRLWVKDRKIETHKLLMTIFFEGFQNILDLNVPVNDGQCLYSPVSFQLFAFEWGLCLHLQFVSMKFRTKT